MAQTKRIELSGGNWAEIRTDLTVADLRAQRQAVHERGYEDNVLDGLTMIPRVVVTWSYGDVTDEVMDTLSIADIEKLSQEFAQAGEAESTSSSAGGNSRKASRPSNG